MRKHPDISRHYEHDSRHFTFVRNTRLPRGTFDDEKKGGNAVDIVIVAFAVLIIVALLLEVPVAFFTEWMK